MDHGVAKLHIRYEAEQIILCGEPRLVHQETARIIERFRFSGCPYRLRNEQADRIELISCGWS